MLGSHTEVRSAHRVKCARSQLSQESLDLRLSLMRVHFHQFFDFVVNSPPEKISKINSASAYVINKKENKCALE
ncbi:hypothetical protein V491_08875 [Pseudogymnoascus sp. VKM F-3775]|nr:hypothetical protein V491_08875 [Pseudogymnoascus sp. VKM F-3775]